MAANRSAGAGIDIRRDYIAWGLAMAALCLHAAFAGRYDVFRDELYFIVCGRHPDFGYADQPPIIPLLAEGFYAPGHSTWLLRLPAVLAAGALPWLSVRFARLLGGGTVAAVGAGLAVTIAPMLMGITATLNTTVFDPLAWTLIAWLLVHAVKSGDERALLLCGLVAGLDLEVKYAGVFWLVSLFIGLLATPERKLFTRKHLWIGGVVCALLAAPSLIWQAVHGFPFLELAAASRGKNTDTPPIAFVLNQVLVMNPLLAPLWVCGVIAPFVMESLRSVRFLSIAFVTCLLLVIVTHGKDYYLAAAYPVMFTVGATAIGQGVRDVWSRTAAIGWAAAAVAFSAWVAPFALPILPVAALKVYVEHFPLKPQQQEKSFKGTLLPQVFADQLGWRDFAREVGTAWNRIPETERARTAIKVDNYGEAAALDVYGKPYGLPPALSGHNQYFIWGPRGQHVVNLLVVQDHPERLTPYCGETAILGITGSPDAMAYENGKVIAFCRPLKMPVETLWPELKNFS